MPLFTNYPKVPYYFGTEDFISLAPNLAAYVDVFDTVKDNSSFYEYYNILRSERPDNLSQKLYGTSLYHWTFLLVNDEIREQGWPLDDEDLTAKIALDHPNTVLTTLDFIHDKFLVGSTIEGVTSGETGTIIKRNIGLGQIFIEGVVDFDDGENITTTEDDMVQEITVDNSTSEALAALYYTTTDGEDVVDIDPQVGPGSAVKVSYTEHFETANSNLRQIRVIKPDSIKKIVDEFKRALA